MPHTTLTTIMGTAAAHSGDNPALAEQLYDWGITHAPTVAATIAAVHRPNSNNRNLTAKIYSETEAAVRIAALANPDVPIEDLPQILAGEQRGDIYLRVAAATLFDDAEAGVARHKVLAEHAPLDDAVRILLDLPTEAAATSTRLTEERGDISGATIERLEFALACDERFRRAVISVAAHPDIQAACLRTARGGDLERRHDTYWNDLVVGAANLSDSLEHAASLWKYRSNPLEDLDALIDSQHHDVERAELDELRGDLTAITDARSEDRTRIAEAVTREHRGDTCTAQWANDTFRAAIYSNDHIDGETLTAYAVGHPCGHDDTGHAIERLGRAHLTGDQLVTIAVAWDNAHVLSAATDPVATCLTYLASTEATAWQRIDALELLAGLDIDTAVSAAEAHFTLSELLAGTEGNPTLATALATTLLERNDIDTVSSEFADSFCGTLDDLYDTISAIGAPAPDTAHPPEPTSI